jgi:hypothetical protein
MAKMTDLDKQLANELLEQKTASNVEDFDSRF